MNNKKEYFSSPAYNPKNVAGHFFEKVGTLMPFVLHINRASDFKLLYISNKLTELTGYTMEDVEQMDGMLVMRINDEDQVTLAEKVAQMQTDKDLDFVKISSRMKHKIDGWVYFETTMSVYERNADGSVDTFICLSEMITSRALIETAKSKYLEMNRLSEEAFLYGSWEWDIASGKVEWSKGVFDLFGIDYETHKDEMTFERYATFIPEESREEVLEELQGYFSRAEPYNVEHEVLTPQGELRHISGKGRPIRDQDDNLTGYLGAVWDVTAFIKVQHELRKNQIKLQEAEALLNIGTWEWNLENDTVAWSDGMWDIFEYDKKSRKRIVTTGFYFKHRKKEETTSDKELVATFWANLKEGDTTPLGTDDIILSNKGNIKHLRTRMQVTDWKKGKPIRAVGSTVDITELKLVHQNLENKITELHKAYDEVEQFAYVASHDLKEPLRKIMTFGERLKSKVGNDLSERSMLYLEKMVDGAQRMNTLIENLLDLSRTKRKPENFIQTDLDEILKNVQQTLEFSFLESDAKLIVPPLPKMEVIPAQIGQLFQNLIGNALKFTKPETSPIITITVNTVNSSEKLKRNLDMFTEYIHFQIKDNGIGFEPEYGQQIFAPFKRLHGRSTYEGTGIGLAICKKVVQNHSGVIWAEGQLDKGSIFHFILPIVQPLTAFQSKKVP